MLAFAPRLPRRLRLAIEAADDSELPIAEICRRAGRRAERMGVARPSYETVRTLVHQSRCRPPAPTPAVVIRIDVHVRCRGRFWGLRRRRRPPESPLVTVCYLKERADPP